MSQTTPLQMIAETPPHQHVSLDFLVIETGSAVKELRKDEFGVTLSRIAGRVANTRAFR